jgi:hypothetical protein
MRKVKNTTALSPAAVARLDEIQQNMRTLCEPMYDEFHKLRVKNGFATITIPKKNRR